MRVACPLVDMPSELLLGIVSWLRPEDILRLQAACHMLHALFHDKEVWTDVLRQTCRAHHIFYPSYPVKEMSVTRLQRASMAPKRFTRLLKLNASTSYNVPRIEPSSTTRVEIGNPERDEKHFLVPGGRYLIIADKCALRLFDLGPPDLAAWPEPILLLRKILEQDNRTPYVCTRLAIHKVKECTLRVVVLVGYESTMVFAYDLTYTDGSVSIDKIGTLKVGNKSDRNCAVLTLSREVTLIQFSGAPLASFSLVWNVSEGWYAHGPRTQVYAMTHVILDRTTVIQYDGHHTTIWSCAAEYLKTYPTKLVTVIPAFDVHDSTFEEAIPHFALPCFGGRTPIEAVRDKLHFLSTSWCDSEDDTRALFECIHDYRPPVTRYPPISPTFLRGHRVSVQPSFNGEAYQATPPQVTVEANHLLPAQAHWFLATETFLPGHGYHTERETPSEYGFTGSAVSNGQRVEDGKKPRVFLYSVERPNPGVELPADVDAPMLKLACLLEEPVPYERQICMASGRLFLTERSAQPADMYHNFNLERLQTRSTAHVYDFLVSCQAS